MAVTAAWCILTLASFSFGVGRPVMAVLLWVIYEIDVALNPRTRARIRQQKRARENALRAYKVIDTGR